MPLLDAAALAACDPELVTADIRRTTYVIVPAYNEAEQLSAVLEPLAAAYPNTVVVDDGSRDQTAAVARRFTSHVLRHSVNCGQGAALQTGFNYALRRGAAYLVTFDADGQHRIEDIARLLAPVVVELVDVALGSRFLGRTEAMPLSRRVLLRGAVAFTRVVSRVRVTDAHNGLRALSSTAAAQLDITMNRMAHASELLDQLRRGDLRYGEVPVTIRYTAYSLAKGQSPRDAGRVLWQYLWGRLLR